MTSSPASVAVLDDDPEFCEFLNQLLSSQGYKVTSYASAGKLLDGIVKSKPSLVVLDVNLPGMNGLELLRVIKRNPETSRVPVVVVSGSVTQTPSVVEGLNDGADEYMTKPLEGELFLARVQTLLRRGGELLSSEPELLVVGPLTLNLSERSVTLKPNSRVQLTKLEFDLLEYLIRHPNRIITRGILLQEVWRQPPDISSRTIDKHVQNLRHKLGAFGEAIETVVKVGYIFRPKTAK